MTLELYRSAADTLIQTFPGTLEPENLAGYGIQVNEQQKQEIHQMLSSLWLYWINCGLRVSVPAGPAHQIEQVIRQWVRDFGNSTAQWMDMEGFFATMERLHKEWDRIMGREDAPVKVLSHAVSVLEDRGTIQMREQQSLLAFFLDYVPIEEIGEVMLTIEAQFAI